MEEKGRSRGGAELHQAQTPHPYAGTSQARKKKYSKVISSTWNPMGAHNIIKAPVLPPLRETDSADIKIQYTTTGIYTPHSDDNVWAKGLFLTDFAAYSLWTHEETLESWWWRQLTMGNGTLRHKRHKRPTPKRVISLL